MFVEKHNLERKEIIVKARVSKEMFDKINELCNKCGMNYATVIRYSIDRLYDEVMKK